MTIKLNNEENDEIIECEVSLNFVLRFDFQYLNTYEKLFISKMWSEFFSISSVLKFKALFDNLLKFFPIHLFIED
jgi:hypothetical protein